MEEECCPKFDRKKWDGKVLEWKNKNFVKDKVFTLFYMPMNFGRVITRVMNKVDASGAKGVDWLALCDHTSKWNMDLYVAVDKDVAGAENVKLNGKYLFKVFEGPYNNIGKWSPEFKEYAKSKGHDIKKWYMWYPYCPKCSKKYGANYVVFIAKV